MADGKTCPTCGKDISFWAVFSAVSPSMIRCGNCRTLVRYGGAGHSVVLIGAMILGSACLTALAAVLMSPLALPLRLALLFPAWIASWMIAEVLVTLYLRSSGRLACDAAQAGWYPDPTGRYQQRYWNSNAWTCHVATGVVTGVDELDSAQGHTGGQ